jgi:hypothetical protein
VTDLSFVVNLGKESVAVFHGGSFGEQDLVNTCEFVHASLELAFAQFIKYIDVLLEYVVQPLKRGYRTSATGVTCVGRTSAGVNCVTFVGSTSSMSRALAIPSIRITNLATGSATSLTF